MPNKTDQAIALWRLANMLCCNQDHRFHELAEAADALARKLATEAGTDYSQLQEQVDADDANIVALLG